MCIYLVKSGKFITIPIICNYHLGLQPRQKPCPPSLFQCKTTRECISYAAKCNGKIECQDGSDEEDEMCRKSPVKHERFILIIGIRIPIGLQRNDNCT